jgi:hypothetical protein
MHIFSKFFILKYLLIYKLTNAGPREPFGNDFLNNFNMFHLSFALTTIFIIKVRFPLNTNILTYEHDIKYSFRKKSTKSKKNGRRGEF